MDSLPSVQECLGPMWFIQQELNVGNVMMVLVMAEPQRHKVTTFGRQWENPKRVRVAMYNPNHADILCTLCVVDRGARKKVMWLQPSPDKVRIFYNYMEMEAIRLGVFNRQEPAPYLLWKDVIEIESDLLGDKIPFWVCWERTQGYTPHPS